MPGHLVRKMGEVYRARDSRLHRDVAIKVLPQSFAAEFDVALHWSGAPPAR